MTAPATEVRHIDWRSVFPWLMLLRTTRFALTPTPLLAATLGVLLTSLGWGLSARVFLGDEYLQVRERVKNEAQFLQSWPRPLELGDIAHGKWTAPADLALSPPFRALSFPVQRLFELKATPLRELAFYVFGILWMFAVWGAAGGIIVRTAVVRFAWEQPADSWQTAQFVGERFLSYCTAPLYPLLGVAILMLPLVFSGLLARFDFGLLFVSLFWLLALLCGLAAVWLLIPLLLGFPLMWGAISAERDGDAFEALSNSIAYTYQRPLKYLGYVLVVLLVGALSVLMVDGAAQATVHLGYWGLAWGSGTERALDIQALAERGTDGWMVRQAERVFSDSDAAPAHPSNVLQAGGWLMGMWSGIVYLIAAAFRYSFFWTAFAGIYLLLRKDVDDKEIDEVYVPHEEPQLAPVSRGAVERPPPIPEPAPSPVPESVATAPPPLPLASNPSPE